MSTSSYYYWQSYREPTAERLNWQWQVNGIHAGSSQVYGGSRRSLEKSLDGCYQARSLMQEAVE